MKKILIIDENAFSRICSAILEYEGHKTEIFNCLKRPVTLQNRGKFGMIITSYPFGRTFFDEIRELNLPTIILTDHINKDITDLLDGFNKSYCMIKPIDYDRFRSLVNEIVNCVVPNTREYLVL